MTNSPMRIFKKSVPVLLLVIANSAVSAPVQFPQTASFGEGSGGRPQVTKEARYSSWGLSCAVAQDDRGSAVERCMISQLVATDSKGEKVVLGITVDYSDSPTVPTMRIRFSPAAKVKAGIGIKIDDHADMRLAINNCNVQRCESVGRLSPEVLKLWRSGKQAQMAFFEQGGKQVLLPVSLSGFDAALSALGRHK